MTVSQGDKTISDFNSKSNFDATSILDADPTSNDCALISDVM